MNILVINPGSTSTKLAVFDNTKVLWEESIRHSAEELSGFRHINEQYDFRFRLVEVAISKSGVSHFDAIIGRGGLLKPIPGGVYVVNEKICDDLLNAKMQHASNLAGLIAFDLSKKYGCPAYIADPVVTDELIDVARFTGIPEIKRISIFHALNSRAIARRYAASIGRKYDELQLIVVHLGGGISVSAHANGKVIDVNNALNGEGPFSPERAGTIPAGQLVDLCFSGKYTREELQTMLCGKAGLLAYLGNTHVGEILKIAREGDMHAKLVLDAMTYSIVKQIGAMHVALHCKTDAIILTGGIAYNTEITNAIIEYVNELSEIVVLPGEDEMTALAENAYGAIMGELPIQDYS